MSPVEALTQIRALCDRVEMPGADGIQYVAIESVRAVLDAVSVDATPAQDIDRAALLGILDGLANEAHYTGERDSWAVYLPPYADRVLALVRTAAASRTREDREAAWQAWKAREAAYRDSSMTDLRQSFEGGWDALASRLEASS